MYWCTRVTSSMPYSPRATPAWFVTTATGNAGPVEPGDRLRRPVDELDAVDRADVSVINDDRAVAIEKDARPRARTHSGRRHVPAAERRAQASLARR